MGRNCCGSGLSQQWRSSLDELAGNYWLNLLCSSSPIQRVFPLRDLSFRLFLSFPFPSYRRQNQRKSKTLPSPDRDKELILFPHPYYIGFFFFLLSVCVCFFSSFLDLYTLKNSTAVSCTNEKRRHRRAGTLVTKRGAQMSANCRGPLLAFQPLKTQLLYMYMHPFTFSFISPYLLPVTTSKWKRFDKSTTATKAWG